MHEREPRKETIGRGELLLLSHLNQDQMFSGYGLIVEDGRVDQLVGLLMVDRPETADPAWLDQITKAYGECQLVPMTQNGDRGLLCRMQISEDSLPHLKQDTSGQSFAIQQALAPLLVAPPAPKLRLSWDEETSLWRSELDMENVLPPEVRELFERFGLRLGM